MSKILSRLYHAWNAFLGKDEELYDINYSNIGYSSTIRPDRTNFSRGNERSIITSVYNRIAIDCSLINIKHVRLDQNGRYFEDIDSGLNNCFTLEANKDQSAKMFVQDIVMSLFDEGCVAIVPIDTDVDPKYNPSFNIGTLRVGKIVQWYPDNVRIEVYNDRECKKQEIVMPKRAVAIIENPLYAIMNERNSVLQRLIRKLNLLDAIDEQSGSGKLNLIVQLPYVVKTEARRKQAELRRSDIEDQLTKSKYGIAYTDGTEHITQLNRPIENDLLKQIEYLTSMLYSQLGITTDVLNGSANQDTMLNYMKRTVEPIMNAIVDELKRKFLTKTARSQKQTVMYFNDLFKLIPIGTIADIADKFTRNEIMTSNEVRQIIGLKPAQDPQADTLQNKNLYPGGYMDPNTMQDPNMADPNAMQDPNMTDPNAMQDPNSGMDNYYNQPYQNNDGGMY